MDHTPIIILAGPTASGKSALAMEMAKTLDVVIINADSKQVYREIPLITAQPSPEEQALVPHRLYGHISVAQHYTVSEWVADAVKTINKTRAEGKIPLLVGGTGMYLNALMKGFSDVPKNDPVLFADACALLEKIGNDAFHQKLDPDMAAKLHPGDTQRMIRAYTVWQQTGKSLAWWQAQKKPVIFPAKDFLCFFLNRPREEVYEDCNRRFEKMVDTGIIDEVKALISLKLDPHLPAVKGHGVPEIFAYLSGEMTLEQAITQAQRNTRHYIKRQYTWFTHQMPEVKKIQADDIKEIVADVLDFQCNYAKNPDAII